MTQEQIAIAKEPIKYFMWNGVMITGHLESTQKTVFAQFTNTVNCYCMFRHWKKIAVFRVTKWK